MKKIASIVMLTLLVVPNIAFAAEGGESSVAWIAASTAIAIALAVLGGTTAQGKAVSAALESIGRNPAAAGKLLVPMILGLALIESLVILAFVIANGLLGKLG